jgi:hypothetical protein
VGRPSRCATGVQSPIHSFFASHLFWTSLSCNRVRYDSNVLKQRRTLITTAASTLEWGVFYWQLCDRLAYRPSFHPGPGRIFNRSEAHFDGQRCSYPEQAIPLAQSTGLYAMSLAQNSMSHRHSWRAMSIMSGKTAQVPICRKFNDQFPYRRGFRPTALQAATAQRA